MKFTGNYNQCKNCNYIYDYEDLCPECGSDDTSDLNAKEVKKYSRDVSIKEQFRLMKMLELHGDL